MNQNTSNYLFVYGTLQSTFQHEKQASIIRSCSYISQASIQAKLYEIDKYPGAVLAANQSEKVYGELYFIEEGRVEETLKTLDEYEECSPSFEKPHEYVRKIITVKSGTKNYDAWCYLYNWDLRLKKQIQSGIYLPSDL